jgi:hypothetical protein
MTHEASTPQQSSPKRLRYNIAIVSLLAGWAIPVLYFGLTDSTPPWIPKAIADRANVSRLFPREHGSFFVYELQAKSTSGGDFEPLHEHLFFQMRPFGYRTRLQRFLGRSTPQSRLSLANWLHDRADARGISIAGLRIVRFVHLTPPSDQVSGRYRQPSSQSAPPGTTETIGEFSFDGNH